MGSVIGAHGLNCLTACGNLSGPGMNQCPLDHQGSPVKNSVHGETDKMKT